MATYSPSVPPRHPLAAAWGPLRWLVTMGLLAIIAGHIQGHAVALMATSWRLEPGWALAAALFLAAFMAVGCACWWSWLGALGSPVRFRDAFRVLFLSNPAKYLPGGIWNFVGRAVLCEQLGVPPGTSTVSMALDLACQLIAALFVGLLLLPGRATGPLAAIAGLLVCGAALGTAFGFRPVVARLGLYMLGASLLGGGFAALAQSLMPAPLTPDQIGLLVGAFLLAWSVGTLTVVCPAGLGAREGALILLLGTTFPPGVPAVLALVARLWLAVGEGLAFLIALNLTAPPK